MTGRQGRTLSGQPARSEKEELKLKRRNKGSMDEASGSKDDSASNHPVAKETGTRGESNAGEDGLSGDEGLGVGPGDEGLDR